MYPTLLLVQKTLTRASGNDTTSVSLTLIRWYMVCGILHFTNSSNHCHVWQVVFQKSTLPHWTHHLWRKQSHKAGGRNRGHVGIEEGEKWGYSQVRWIQNSGQKKETECMVWSGGAYFTLHLDVPPLEPTSVALLLKIYSYQKQMHSIKLNNIRALTYRSLKYFQETTLKIIPRVFSEWDL